MSGHSKWATIKRKKGATDARRGALFTKLAREIAIAAREGPDPEYNFRLRLAVDKAKANSMPKDNIERAIRRGSGADRDADFEELFYEGYGPNGTALLLQVLTDNRNRALSEIRRAFTRGGGNLGEAGSVAWQFDTKGRIVVNMEGQSQNKVFEWVVEAGAEDVQFGDEEAEIVTDPTDLQAVRENLQHTPLEILDVELTYVPKIPLALGPKETVQVMQLMENLEDLDDVTKVYSNLEISDEALAEMEMA